MLTKILQLNGSKSFTVLLVTFLNTGDDLIIAHNGNNVSTRAILQQLNITGNFHFGAFCPRDEHSCKMRCINGAPAEPAERKKKLPCYCDSHCLDVGDCCYDFFFR